MNFTACVQELAQHHRVAATPYAERRFFYGLHVPGFPIDVKPGVVCSALFYGDQSHSAGLSCGMVFSGHRPQPCLPRSVCRPSSLSLGRLSRSSPPPACLDASETVPRSLPTVRGAFLYRATRRLGRCTFQWPYARRPFRSRLLLSRVLPLRSLFRHRPPPGIGAGTRTQLSQGDTSPLQAAPHYARSSLRPPTLRNRK